jgi:putative MATE family efflux protein
MWIMAVSNILNIGLAPLFIFGLGPLPRMGVEGAAVATVISQAVAAGLAVHILLSGKARLHIRPRQWKPNLTLSWRILRIGLPGSGQMFSRSLMSAVMMWIVATCGTAAVAAYGVGMRFHMIILMPLFALGGAAATMVGQNLGAGKPDRAHHAAWVATVIGMLFMVVAAVIMMLFAPTLIRVFNREPDVVQIGARYLQIVSPFYVFAALGIVLGRALNGAGDSMSPMVITILSLWGLQVPLAVYLSRIWQPATQGIWWAIAIAFVIQGLLIVGWFETGRWKLRKV